MFLGHYGVAFAAKRASPETSLGTLTFAAQWLDELWPILLLLGVEQVRIAPGVLAASQLDFVNYPISHSLLTAVGWSIVLGLAYFIVRRRSRGAWIVAALVLSHWVLDFMVHAPDLPLYPGGPRVGLGAWRSVPLTLVLEAIVYGWGLFVYTRTVKPRWPLWTLVIAQVGLYLAAFVGPPPPDVRVLAWSGIILWVFIPWAAWVDRSCKP